MSGEHTFLSSWRYASSLHGEQTTDTTRFPHHHKNFLAFIFMNEKRNQLDRVGKRYFSIRK